MGKGDRAKPVQSFQLMHQSYEDKDTTEALKHVLVPVNTRTRKPLKAGAAVRFAEDLVDDTQLRLNMRMADDEVEDRIFDDEDEADFDNEFIKQMMTGDGLPNEFEEFEEMADDEYPEHAERRAIERQFDRVMDEFDMDEDIEEDDPRAQGPLDVLDYAPALEEFVQENAGVTYFDAEHAHRFNGLMNQMRNLASDHRVFDSNAQGHFVTTLKADKGKRLIADFHENKEEMKSLTLQSIRAGHIDTTDVLCREDGDEPLVPITLKPRGERMDCETALSTCTNVYNNPTVIGGQTKKMRLSVAAARKARAEQQAAQATRHVDAAQSAGKKSPAVAPAKIVGGGRVAPMPTTEATSSSAAVAAEEDDEDLFADLPDEALPSMLNLSKRPKDETKEEKQLRRALVKEMQRERRQEKKSTKLAYRDAGIAHAQVDQKQKLDKKLVPMSVVRRS